MARLCPWRRELPGKPFVVLVVGRSTAPARRTTVGKLAQAIRRCRQEGSYSLAWRHVSGPQPSPSSPSGAVSARGADLIRTQQGSGSRRARGLAFDALAAAKSRGADVLLVDTAGRLHNKVNLMEELKKIRLLAGQARPRSPARNPAGTRRDQRAECPVAGDRVQPKPPN